MKKLLYILSKDIKIFFRDIRSFALLFLTPIMLVILIGTAFLGTQPSNVPIIVCGDDTSQIYNDIVKILEDSSVFEVKKGRGNCTEIIETRIKNSMVRAGIIIENDGIATTMDIMIDNTKPVSTYLHSYFSVLTRDMTQKMTNAVISGILSNMDNITDEIDNAHSDLVSYSNMLSGVSSGLNVISGQIDSLYDDINNIGEVRLRVSDSVEMIDNLKVDLETTSSRLDTINNDVQLAQTSIESLDISEFEKQIILSNLNSMQTTLVLAGNSLNTMRTNINSAENALSDSQTILDYIDTHQIISNLDNIKKLIPSSISTINNVKNNIDELAERLLDAKSKMLGYSEDYDPSSSRQINPEISRFFGDKRYIDFVFPSILIMILMLMSTFLSSTSFIRQRSTGLLKRISISPTSINFLLLEKTLFNTIISLIPLPFIFAAGIFILGVEINIMNILPITAVCAVLIALFVLLGLIIASFSKTESTAILASLIIVIPMMFLSGT
ncbi:MAG: ABC transporter permease, partial [Candidatus Peribacteraceae bacterium]|nr:ABC transporter permease [Candidatus Peribacteraceae bacterium]